MVRQWYAAVVLVVGLVGCGGAASTTAPVGGGTDQDIHFLTPAGGAPSLAETTVSFWAFRDRNTEGSIWYRPRSGGKDSTELLEFKVPNESIAEDSVLITMTVVDTARLIVQFSPAGLQFASDRPARLKMRYAEEDDDIDDNGTVDATDDSLKASLSIWRRETPSDPWVRLPSTSITASDDVEADISGFTQYAIAF